MDEIIISEALPIAEQRAAFAAAARAYREWLFREHLNCDTERQGRQRMITLSSLRPPARQRDFHLFNELLVQYRKEGGRIGQIVPRNMVVLHKGALDLYESYDVPLQPVRPFWVMEYLEPRRGIGHRGDPDYFRKYEAELRVPYLMVVDLDARELTLYRHGGRNYEAVKPGSSGRVAIPELEIELGLVNGVVRYWHGGELLLLPSELQNEIARLRAEKARLEGTTQCRPAS